MILPEQSHEGSKWQVLVVTISFGKMLKINKVFFSPTTPIPISSLRMKDETHS